MQHLYIQNTKRSCVSESQGFYNIDSKPPVEIVGKTMTSLGFELDIYFNLSKDEIMDELQKIIVGAKDYVSNSFWLLFTNHGDGENDADYLITLDYRHIYRIVKSETCSRPKKHIISPKFANC
jgi:hypothetical protein